MINPSNNNIAARKHHKYTEYRLIFKALYEFKQPMSRRQLSIATGLEIANLCRALFNLQNKKRLLKIAQVKPCATTGKRVYHYYFADKKGGQNGN